MQMRGTILLRYIFLLALLGGIFLYGGMHIKKDIEYDVHATSTAGAAMRLGTSSLIVSPHASSTLAAPEVVVTHLLTPVPLKAAYMTSCIASGKKLRAPLVKFVEATELNALVIDIKDFSGMVSIDTGDPHFVVNTHGCNIPDIREFIAELHSKGIYVIGRVTVMQDQVYTKSHPDAAVKRKSDGATWHDNKGLAFVDPGASEYWQYMVDLGKASHGVGFDEINYDYIRYPSDGDMANAKFTRTGSTTKAAMMKKFYAAVGGGMRQAGVPTSADLFGMTTTNTDDLGIGQVLENALISFDFVAPMVYPSHYPPNFNGWKDPNLVPYEIVKFSMQKAVTRANMLEQIESGWVAPVVASSSATSTHGTASSTAKFVPKGIYAQKLRPWIEDFDCCAPHTHDYTEADVRAQMKAVYNSGLTSWMMWDPKNIYTKSAYDSVSGSPVGAASTSVR